MQTLLAISGVLLALVVAGLVAWVAWEVTRQASGDDRSRSDDRTPND